MYGLTCSWRLRQIENALSELWERHGDYLIKIDNTDGLKVICPECNQDTWMVDNTVSDEIQPGLIERIRYMVCTNPECGHKKKDVWYLSRKKSWVCDFTNLA